MNFKGQFQPTMNMRCQKCGKGIGPLFPLKMAYRQYGAGGGTFCSNTCCKAAYEEVVKENPQFITKVEQVFKG